MAEEGDANEATSLLLLKDHREPSFFESVLQRAEEVVEELTTFEELDVPAIDTAIEDENIEDLNELVPFYEDFDSCDSIGIVEPIVHPEDPFLPEKLSFLPLVVLIFYNVSGGPFGIESAVRSAGPLLSLLGFAIAPFVWSIQEALMTAELGTAFPEASGGVAWVEEAFGANAGWLSGYLGWVAGATDNAIYPVLFMDYLLQAIGENAIGKVPRFLLLSSISILLGYVNWKGLAVVGKLSLSISFVAMSPFIILTLVGIPRLRPSRWLELPSEVESDVDEVQVDGFFPQAAWCGVLWRPFLNNLFWNLNSFDATGSFAADIENPSVILPRALMWSVAMVVMAYLIPLMVALGATEAHQHDWVDGYLTRIATEVVGPWLGAYTVFAAGISNIAMFQAELSADAFQLMGMADRGHVPKLFSVRSRHGTPTFGIILGTAVIVSMGASHLDQLIEMLNFNYAISLLMEYAAFFKLRFARPDLIRPWRIPLSNWACVALFTPTLVLTLFLMSLASYLTYWFCLGVAVFGVVLFYAKTLQIDSIGKTRAA